MNSCGINIPHILNSFLQSTTDKDRENELNFLEEDYYFSEWYYAIKNDIQTMESWFFDYDDLYNGKINSMIRRLGGECFARTDSCSTKPNKSYKSAEEILSDFKTSDRCRDYFSKTKRDDIVIVLRRYIHNFPKEFRCFIHEKKLRGISSQIPLTSEQIIEIEKKVNKITHYLCEDNYSCDFVYLSSKLQTHDNKQLMLVEINSPVYLFATSGAFDLDVPADRMILFGEYLPDVISYPIVRYDN